MQENRCYDSSDQRHDHDAYEQISNVVSMVA